MWYYDDYKPVMKMTLPLNSLKKELEKLKKQQEKHMLKEIQYREQNYGKWDKTQRRCKLEMTWDDLARQRTIFEIAISILEEYKFWEQKNEVNENIRKK